jgi:hypothetical protein
MFSRAAAFGSPFSCRLTTPAPVAGKTDSRLLATVDENFCVNYFVLAPINAPVAGIATWRAL